jgi:hypothetical protein
MKNKTGKEKTNKIDKKGDIFLFLFDYLLFCFSIELKI